MPQVICLLGFDEVSGTNPERREYVNLEITITFTQTAFESL